jgi:hypothetical protein
VVPGVLLCYRDVNFCSSVMDWHATSLLVYPYYFNDNNNKKRGFFFAIEDKKDLFLLSVCLQNRVAPKSLKTLLIANNLIYLKFIIFLNIYMQLNHINLKI